MVRDSMRDTELHEATEARPPVFEGGKLYSLLDILGGGEAVCDLCGRWQKFVALTPAHAQQELEQSGWCFEGGKDICPRCAKSNE